MQEPSLQHFTMIVLDSGFLSPQFLPLCSDNYKAPRFLEYELQPFQTHLQNSAGPGREKWTTAVPLLNSRGWNVSSCSGCPVTLSLKIHFLLLIHIQIFFFFFQTINKVLVECNHPEHWKIKWFAKLN